MYYELWDVETANMVGTYDTESDALGAVRRMMDKAGSDAAEPCALAVVDEEDRATEIARGRELGRLATERAHA